MSPLLNPLWFAKLIMFESAVRSERPYPRRDASGNRDNIGRNGEMPIPPSALDLFKGRHFDQEIIVLCVRWYLSFKLSSRDLVRMMAERGVVLTHTTILRWVQRYVPEFEKRWSCNAGDVDGSWRCDETYIKVKGRWTYLYRAVDKHGRTVDFSIVRAPRCGRRQTFLSESNPTQWNATRDHSRRLCRFASGDPGTEI